MIKEVQQVSEQKDFNFEDYLTDGFLNEKFVEYVELNQDRFKICQEIINHSSSVVLIFENPQKYNIYVSYDHIYIVESISTIMKIKSSDYNSKRIETLHYIDDNGHYRLKKHTIRFCNEKVQDKMKQLLTDIDKNRGKILLMDFMRR